MTNNNYKEWKKIAEKELKEKDINELNWDTPEGIRVKPLYTEEDLKDLEHEIGFPGLPPYTRGPRATMYSNRPWTLGNMLAFQLLKNQINFIKKV